MTFPATPRPLSPEGYVIDVFSSKAARSGGVIRRKARDIDRYVGRAAFLNEVERRGFRAIENAGQIIILCNREEVRLLI